MGSTSIVPLLHAPPKKPARRSFQISLYTICFFFACFFSRPISVKYADAFLMEALTLTSFYSNKCEFHHLHIDPKKYKKNLNSFCDLNQDNKHFSENDESHIMMFNKSKTPSHTATVNGQRKKKLTSSIPCLHIAHIFRPMKPLCRRLFHIKILCIMNH